MAKFNIGFEEDQLKKIQDIPEEKITKKDGETFVKFEQKDVYISPKHRESILKDYDCVVVHEFGDDYHLSEEERESRNKFYKIFSEFNRYKKKYRDIEQYIKAVRCGLECLEAVAQNNDVYDPEEFKKKWAKGKITISGLIFPKYIGSDRKKINMKVLFDFIISGRPVHEFTNMIDSDFRYDMNEIDTKNFAIELLGEEEVMRMANSRESDRYENGYFFDEKLEGSNVALEMSKKKQKNLSKQFPELFDAIKLSIQIDKDKQGLDSAYASELREEDIDSISAYDLKNGHVEGAKIPEFQGSAMNEDDVRAYMYKCERSIAENVKNVQYNNALYTQDEVDMLEFKDALEEAGLNVRQFYNTTSQYERQVKSMKKDIKNANKIKKNLIKMDAKRNKRLISDAYASESFTTPSNKKKSKKKKDKKSSKLKGDD